MIVNVATFEADITSDTWKELYSLTKRPKGLYHVLLESAILPSAFQRLFLKDDELSFVIEGGMRTYSAIFRLQAANNGFYVEHCSLIDSMSLLQVCTAVSRR